MQNKCFCIYLQDEIRNEIRKEGKVPRICANPNKEKKEPSKTLSLIQHPLPLKTQFLKEDLRVRIELQASALEISKCDRSGGIDEGGTEGGRVRHGGRARQCGKEQGREGGGE